MAKKIQKNKYQVKIKAIYKVEARNEEEAKSKTLEALGNLIDEGNLQVLKL